MFKFLLEGSQADMDNEQASANKNVKLLWKTKPISKQKTKKQ